jgi:ParB-like chromosome segregation protein Spo0J
MNTEDMKATAARAASNANPTIGSATTIGSNAKPQTPTAHPVGTLLEGHYLAKPFPLEEGKELDELAEDIRRNGQLEPGVVYEGKVLDGRRRNLACNKAGVSFLTVPYEGTSPASFVISKNLQRRNLTTSQRAAIGVEMLPFVEAEAKLRQQTHGGTAPGKPKTLGAEMREVSEGSGHDVAGGESVPFPAAAGKSAEVVAKAMSVSPRLVEEAKALKKKDPAEFEKVKSGEKTVTEAARELKKRTQKLEIELPPELKGKKFQLIYADVDRLNERFRAAFDFDQFLDAISTDPALYLLKCPYDAAPPVALGSFTFKATLVLKRAVPVNVQALGLCVRHSLLFIYSRGRGLSGNKTIEGILPSGDPTATFAEAFGDVAKVSLTHAEDCQGWSRIHDIWPPRKEPGTGGPKSGTNNKSSSQQKRPTAPSRSSPTPGSLEEEG